MAAREAEATRTFLATPEGVSDIDAWMEDVGAGWDLPERTVFRARVCVSELAANVLEHGGAHAQSDPLSVTLRNRAPALEIEFTDPGRPFDPVAAPETSGPDDEDGGRGLRLLRAYASHLDYQRVGNSNVLIFHITAPPAA